MEEKAVRGAAQLIDYGTLGIFCLVLLAGFVFCALLLKNNYEKNLKEKDQHIADLRRELADIREGMGKRLNDTIDHCADAISENSKALYEVGSVVSENKGVLLSIHELMKK